MKRWSIYATLAGRREYLFVGVGHRLRTIGDLRAACQMLRVHGYKSIYPVRVS